MLSDYFHTMIVEMRRSGATRMAPPSSVLDTTSAKAAGPAAVGTGAGTANPAVLGCAGGVLFCMLRQQQCVNEECSVDSILPFCCSAQASGFQHRA